VPTTSNRSTASHWQLIALLTLVLMISYVDRGNFSTAAPLMKRDLGFDEAQIGLLYSAFYWTYVAMMFPAGWATERFGAHRVLAAGVFLWSLATLLTGFVATAATILLLRLMLGMGESPVFPASSNLLAANLPRDRLGGANGIISFGYLVGPAIGTWVATRLMDQMGWRHVFVLFGALSLAWLLPWMRYSRGATMVAPVAETLPASAEVTPDTRRILRERSLWGAALGHFASNYNWYFILSFLPLYLVDKRGMSMSEMGDVAFWAYGLNALGSVAAGLFTDRWIRIGRSPTRVYKFFMVINHVVSIAAMAGMVMLPLTASLACLYAYQVFLGFSSPGVFGIGQILAGPRATGRWIGIQNCLGNMSGIISPALGGILIKWNGGDYTYAFGVVCLVNLLGILGWGVILQKIEPVDWSRSTARP
jgi:MFS family permease